MKKLLITLIVVIVVAGAAGGAYYYKYGKTPEPEITYVQVTRGDVVKAVGATGTVEAVTTVDVGTQVNGVIKEMYADFNKIVKKGELIAKIDPATIEATIERDKANLESGQANLERQKVALEDSKNKLRRAEDLFKRSLITQQDLETAQVTVKSNDASVKAQEAAIKQTQAQLNQDMVNLGYTNIYAPIDGIVINRKVDVGQTVVSNNAATSMFQIAEDLTKMQLKASVDESDVGNLRPGQVATFRVDAYPTKEFRGTVSQVRLQPVVSQNVVTYTTIINVPNPNLELKPGMTANVKIEIARRENVLRVPLAATRFRPTREIFEALNIPVPPELLQRGRGGRGQGLGQNAMSGGPAPAGQAGSQGSAAFQRGGGDRAAQPADQPASFQRGTGRQGVQGQARGEGPRGTTQGQQAQGGERPMWNRGGQGSGQPGEGAFGQGGRGGQGFQQMTPEERQKRMQERLAQMTPEQRAQFEERMKQWAQSGGGRGQGPGWQRPGNEGGSSANRPQGATPGANARRPGSGGTQAGQGIADRGAGTIDALFGDLSFGETFGRAWVYAVNGTTKSLKSVTFRYDIDDGTMVALTTGADVEEGMRLVSNIDTGQNNGQSVRPNASPFMPGGPRPGMGGPGGFGGGGRGR